MTIFWQKILPFIQQAIGLFVLVAALLVSSVALAQDNTTKIIADATNTLSSGVKVWITADALGADFAAINQEIAAFPDLNIRVLVVGPDNAQADVATIAKATVTQFQGTAMVFTNAEAYVYSDLLSQQRVENAVSSIQPSVASEADVALAVRAIATALQDTPVVGKPGAANANGSYLSYLMLLGLGIVMIGFWLYWNRKQSAKKAVEEPQPAAREPVMRAEVIHTASDESSFNRTAADLVDDEDYQDGYADSYTNAGRHEGDSSYGYGSKAAGYRANEGYEANRDLPFGSNQNIQEQQEEAHRLEEQIASAIVDISDMLLLQKDPKLEQQFMRLVLEYERFSTSIDDTKTVAGATNTRVQLERIQLELQSIMAELV